MPRTAKAATLAQEQRLPPEVSAFIAARPVIAAEFPRIQDMIAAAFDHPEVAYQVMHHDEQDPEPTLSITINFREAREDARRTRRALLGGPWLDLSAFTLARVALHLGQPLE